MVGLRQVLDGEEGVLMNARAIFKYSLIPAVLLAFYSTNAIITTLSRNDPAPPYTTDNPFAFLGTSHYEYLKEHSKLDSQKHFVVELIPFYQRASSGSDSCGCESELGDINGRWNMIALLPFNEPNTTYKTSIKFPIPYTNTNNDLPCGQIFPGILQNIRNELLSDIQDIIAPNNPQSLPPELKTVQGLLDLQQSNTNLNTNFGYFAAAMKYKKSGVRFNAEFYIGKGIGFTLQTGIATIDQCATFSDRTPYARCTTCYSNPFTSFEHGNQERLSAVYTTSWNTAILRKVSTDLMSKLDAIVSSTDINYSLCPFHETSMEDLNAELFWRFPTRINKDTDDRINKDTDDEDYPKFLFIPFFAVGGTYAVSKPQNLCQLTSLPFGDNGHSAVRVRGGFSLDFYDTVDINFELGATAFKGRSYLNMPMPNNASQHPIYPFKADAYIHPGRNFHIALGATAHNFWYKWSSSFHYIYVNHDLDCITLTSACYPHSIHVGDKLIQTCTSSNVNAAAGKVGEADECRTNIHPFKPEVLMCNSKWTAQMFDWSLNYAISPDFTIGGLIQIPVRRKAAYRSSTFMLSLFINI